MRLQPPPLLLFASGERIHPVYGQRRDPTAIQVNMQGLQTEVENRPDLPTFIGTIP